MAPEPVSLAAIATATCRMAAGRGVSPLSPRVCGVIPLRVIPVKFLSVLRRIAFLMQPSGICMLACYGSMLNDAATRNRVHDAFKA